MKVYMAIPLDYAVSHEQHLDRWFHHAEYWPVGADVYCPHCSFVPGEQPKSTIIRNTRALTDADVLVAIFDGTVSFGVPVEVWTKSNQSPFRVCLIHPAPPGVFVRYLEAMGVTVVDFPEEALMWAQLQANALQDALPWPE